MSPSEAHLNYITLHPVLPKKKIQLLNCCNLAGEANSMKYAIASSHFGRHWVKVQYVQKMLNTHKYRYSFSCIGPHTHTYIHRHRHSHTHSHTFMETQFHVHTHTHTHTHAHTHPHICTCTRTLAAILISETTFGIWITRQACVGTDEDPTHNIK